MWRVGTASQMVTAFGSNNVTQFDPAYNEVDWVLEERQALPTGTFATMHFSRRRGEDYTIVFDAHDWNALTSYPANRRVEYQNHLYQAKIDVPAGQANNPTNTTYWWRLSI